MDVRGHASCIIGAPFYMSKKTVRAQSGLSGPLMFQCKGKGTGSNLCFVYTYRSLYIASTDPSHILAVG